MEASSLTKPVYSQNLLFFVVDDVFKLTENI